MLAQTISRYCVRGSMIHLVCAAIEIFRWTSGPAKDLYDGAYKDITQYLFTQGNTFIQIFIVRIFLPFPKFFFFYIVFEHTCCQGLYEYMLNQ